MPEFHFILNIFGLDTLRKHGSVVSIQSNSKITPIIEKHQLVVQNTTVHFMDISTSTEFKKSWPKVQNCNLKVYYMFKLQFFVNLTVNINLAELGPAK